MPPDLAVRKAATLEILDCRKDGGSIRITTPSADRDRDRVLPLGGRVDRYLRNPIVTWAHQTWEPWQTIGRTDQLEVSEAGMVAQFTLREPVNDQDPQHIVRQLWGERWINASSIGFQPLQATPNDLGGLDFMVWELLEWGLVPIPANADALRLAYDAHPAAAKSYSGWLVKAGRVLSKANEKRLRDAHGLISEVLDQIAEDDEGDGKSGPRTFPALPRDPRAIAEAIVAQLPWLASPEAAAAALAPLLAPGTPPAPAPHAAPAPIDLTSLHAALGGLKAALSKE